MFRSTNAGATWQGISWGLADFPVRALALSPAHATDRTLYAGTTGGGVFRGVAGQ